MAKVNFLEDGTAQDSQITYVVTMARYRDKWIMVRNKERSAWELPGGTREPGETVRDAAARELFEETGSIKFMLYPVSLYSVTGMGPETYGYIFYADVSELGVLPDYEIAEISLIDSLPDNLVYPLLQPDIFHKVAEFDCTKSKAKSWAYCFES